MQLIDIKGVGDKTLLKLHKLGINTIDELVRFMPKFYFDMTHESDLNTCAQGDYVLLQGQIIKKNKVAYIRRGFTLFKCTLLVQGQKVVLSWYNLPYVSSQIELNNEYVFWGKISKKDGLSISNPSFETIDNIKRLQGIVPIYPLKGEIGQQQFRNYISCALEKGNFYSPIDEFDSMSLLQAFKLIHFPTSMDQMRLGKDRYNLEDLITQYIAYRTNKNSINNLKQRKYALPLSSIDSNISSLPFELTQTQKTALKEIIEDLKGKERTNRMLLGDVGSGKTVVALLTCLYVIKCGYQCAIMVPTEILANQHFINAKKILANANINIALLTSSTDASAKKQILKDLKDGSINLIIGTHAILGSKVEFNNLAYIIIDELHKFGVKQKGTLEEKARNCDVLSMSATPIPRAIALTIYGDLQISRLENREGTSKITTHILGDNKIEGMYDFIKERVHQNEQAYIVCPLVLDSEGMEVYSAKMLYFELTHDQMKNEKVGLIYGSMKDSEKAKVMSDFYERKIDVLIATSVIEVGIDSQYASIMAVLNADRFGLATLHQLRGRIGRKAGLRSYCFLHTSNSQENVRLNALTKYKDGHSIAEFDASIRGFGDFLGMKQSGGSFKGDSIITKELIQRSKSIADKLLSQGCFDIHLLVNMDYYLEKLRNISLN